MIVEVIQYAKNYTIDNGWTDLFQRIDKHGSHPGRNRGMVAGT